MARIHLDATTKGNPGRSTYVITTRENSQRYTFTHDLGEMDSHSAEWTAVLRALGHARELEVSNVLLFTGSKLIEDSMMQGKVKNAKFEVYFENIEVLEQSFNLMLVRWIPRKQNKEANQLTQQILYKLTS